METVEAGRLQGVAKSLWRCFMKVVYPIILTQTKDDKGTVLVYVPDLDWSTEGYGLANAMEMAEDCIGSMLLNVPDAELPPASEIDEVDVSKGVFYNDGKSFISLVGVDLDCFRRMQRTRTVRRNITLPEWLDSMAAKAKINVSAIAQAALKERLGVAMA